MTSKVVPGLKIDTYYPQDYRPRDRDEEMQVYGYTYLSFTVEGMSREGDDSHQ